MPRPLQTLLTALILALLYGCTEDDVPKTDYFPLRDGNHWEFRLLDRPLLGRLNAGQEIATGPLNTSENPDAEKTDDTEPSAEIVDVLPNGAVSDVAKKIAGPGVTARRVALDLQAAVDELTFKAVYDTAEQVWSKRSGYVGFQSQKGRSYLLILPPHTRYRWVVTGSAGQNLYYEIETARGEVSTPAGKFTNCAVARQENRDRKDIYKYWFAPNVGLVRRSRYFAGEEVFRQELVEYKVQPAKQETRDAEEKEVKKAIEGKKRGNEFKSKNKDEEGSVSRIDDYRALRESNDKAAKDSSPR